MLSEVFLIESVIENFMENDTENLFYIFNEIFQSSKQCFLRLRDQHIEGNWIDTYSELQFYRFFRMTRTTVMHLLQVVCENDTCNVMQKRYIGGQFPVSAHKCLLIFLYYIAHQDTLNSIGNRFKVTDSTVMNICNNILYIVVRLKLKYIFWPQSPDEFTYITQGFQGYPGVIGAVDGCHINIKVPVEQQDSYIDRYLQHSINLMAICTASKIFTYIFVGFPGSAHDARVFSNSRLYRDIEQYGKERFFPKEEYHLIGDEAFALRTWLMKPYRTRPNTPRIQRVHNKKLSSCRVCIENTFGILKGRWRRLQFINTYSVAKATEIVTAACVLHNFTYLNDDVWNGEIYDNLRDERPEYAEDYNDRYETALAQAKRNRIAQTLLN